MRRTLYLLLALVFTASLFPAALAADERRDGRLEREDRRPPLGAQQSGADRDRDRDRDRDPDGHHEWERHKPGRPNNFNRPNTSYRPGEGRPGQYPNVARPNRPQWSVNIHPRPLNPWYKPCPPYCDNRVYIYKEEERQSKYFTENSEPQAEAEAPPPPQTYFQGGGVFERMEDERNQWAPQAPLTEEDYQADMDRYNLMLRAWE